jgi:hypothetical protein
MDGDSSRLIKLNLAPLPVPEEQWLSFRARQVLNLELQGLRKVEIAVRLGLAESTVSSITLTPGYIAVRNARLDHYTHATIRAMIPQAVRTLEEGLRSPSEHIRMVAATTVFKILGYMHHGKECEAYANNGMTAEDVCRLLLAAQSTEQPPVAQVQEQLELQEAEQAQAAAL